MDGPPLHSQAPLYIAASRGNERLVGMLIDAGADATRVTAAGERLDTGPLWPPLTVACGRFRGLWSLSWPLRHRLLTALRPPHDRLVTAF